MNADTILAPAAPRPALVTMDLFATAMHHGRNLVMSSRGYAELIASPHSPSEKQGEWASRIVHNLDQLEELYGRIDELREEPTSPGEKVSLALTVDCACRRAVSRVRARAHDAHVGLNLEADPLVVGNGQQLTRAISVFVENAIEADPEQTARVALSRTDEGSWCISITDRGDGMEEEDRRRFGKTFFTRKTGRVGMGVFVGRSLLEHLGMVFTLTSEPQRGTRITIQPRRGR